MEVRLGNHNLLDIACPDDPVSKRFALLALNGVSLDDGAQLLDDFFVAKRLFVELGKTLAVVTAAEVDVVRSRRFADKCDFGVVRAGTAVRAT